VSARFEDQGAWGAGGELSVRLLGAGRWWDGGWGEEGEGNLA
jgi:hypothetical protein